MLKHPTMWATAALIGLTSLCGSPRPRAALGEREIPPPAAHAAPRPLLADFNAGLEGRGVRREGRHADDQRVTTTWDQAVAFEGEGSLRIDYRLTPGGQSVAVETVRLEGRALPDDLYGFEFQARTDAPDAVELLIDLRERSGEIWQQATVFPARPQPGEWMRIPVVLDMLRLVTWTRENGRFDLDQVEGLDLVLSGARGADGPRSGSLWIDAFGPLDPWRTIGGTDHDGFHLLDLSGVFNSDAVAWKSNPLDGDFHTGEWQQRTLPAEHWPDAPVATYHGVPFAMPSVADGLNNHLRSQGQCLTGFAAGPYSAAYFLASGKFGDQAGDVTLYYADGTTTRAALDISDWSVGPTRGDQVAIRFPFTYHEHRTEPRMPMIYLQSIRLDPTRPLVGLRLPRRDYLKVFSITLARRDPPPAAGALHDRPLEEIDPRYRVVIPEELSFAEPARSAGVYGGYLARRNEEPVIDVPTLNGGLAFSIEGVQFPRHTLQWPRALLDNSDYPLGQIQIDARQAGHPILELVSSTCMTYTAPLEGHDGHPFKVYLSRVSPAALYEIGLEHYRWHEPGGGPTHVAYADGDGVTVAPLKEGAALPLPAEPWLLLWHADRKPDAFDAPMLLVLERKPERIEVARRMGSLGLNFRHAGTAGHVAVMPLHGIERIAADVTAGWAAGLPADVAQRCRAWAARLQRYPLEVTTTPAPDEAAGRITFTEHFRYLDLATQWDVTPRSIAPVPPVAALARAHGYPVEWGAGLRPLDYATLWGPLVAAEGDSASWSIPLPDYLERTLIPTNVTGDPFIEQMKQDLAGRLRNIPRRINSDNSGDSGAMKLYAPAHLIIGENAAIADYCRRVARNILNPDNIKVEKELQTGQFFLMDDRFWCADAAYDKEWAIGHMLQGLWQAAYHLDDTALLRENWDTIRGLYRYYQIIFDWPTASTYTMVTGQGANSDGIRFAWEGMLGMARMARMVGDEPTWRDVAARSALQMMNLYASWFAPQWAVAHDYTVAAGRRIPVSEAETGFAPDGWAETTGVGLAHDGDFFQVTHAFFMYHPDQLLYLHDYGLDEARLRPWLMERVPALHPNWDDGNVRGDGWYYGSSHSVAHLVVRSLLLHQPAEEVHAHLRRMLDDTRVLKEWYSPEGAASFALMAMVTGAAPLAAAPVGHYYVTRHDYDAAGGRQVLEMRRTRPGATELRVRCWGRVPRAVEVNGEPRQIDYDPASDYLRVPLTDDDGETARVVVQHGEGEP